MFSIFQNLSKYDHFNRSTKITFDEKHIRAKEIPINNKKKVTNLLLLNNLRKAKKDHNP